jgi:twitching motility protein PilT
MSSEAISGTAALKRLLDAAFKLNVSDIHIRAERRPMYRVHGQLRAVDFPEVPERDLDQLCADLSGYSAERLRERRTAEFSCQWGKEGRFRGHYYLNGGKSAVALRTIPMRVPSLQELRLPATIKQLCNERSGLIMVSGATGMGKTTTLAAMLDTVAKSSCRHIVTIEDPIEYVIDDSASCVTQREVGRDIETFDDGLVSVLRQDPDVVMIGEVRDGDTMRVALHAATTGHLVLTAAHYTDTTAAIAGMISMMPGSEQASWRFQLANALVGIIALRLLPRRDGAGRVMATELLINEPSVTACIQDETKMKGIRAALARGRNQYGSHTLDQSLLELLSAKLVSLEAAQVAAVSPSELMREVNLRRIGT